MSASPEAILSGLCCRQCGTIVTLNGALSGNPRLCATCEALEPKPKAKKIKGPWKPRKRSWPNGREYWIVGDGKGRFLCGKSGGESKFYDKAEAQHWADEHNKDEPEAEAASRSKVDAR